MQEIEQLTRTGFIFNNHLVTWILALAVFLILVAIAPRAREFLSARLLAREGVSHSNVVFRVLQALADSTRHIFIIALALLAAKQVLILPIQAERIVSGIVLTIATIQAGIWASALVRLWIEHYLLSGTTEDPERSSAAQIIRIISLTIVWSAIILMALSNFGVDITGLVAGLGVGGIAIAFALQSILKDLFASLAIILDKPFVVGDFINFDDQLGSVEQIGLKTTRLRALSGEQLTVSNDALLASRVRNYKRMSERRIVFDLNTHFDTPVDKLMALPQFLRTVIEAIPGTRFDRSHLAEFTPMGPRIETVYYVLSPDYGVYMDIQQKVLFEAAQWFENNGLAFAQPSRRILVEAETRGKRPPFPLATTEQPPATSG